MGYLLILAFASITAYCLGIASKLKARKSISDSDYWLTSPWKWVFEAVIIFNAMVLVATGASLGSYMTIAGGVGIGLVAIFSRFKKNKFFHTMHMIGAVGGFSCLILSFLIDFHAWYITLSIVVFNALIWLFTRHNRSVTWNVEVSIIYTYFLGLIYYLMYVVS